MARKKKFKSIEKAPKNIRDLASQFYGNKNASVEMPGELPKDLPEVEVREITEDLILEVFQNQFKEAKNSKGYRITWSEYLQPTEEMKEEYPSMEIFIKSTTDLPSGVVGYFLKMSEKLEYWVRPSNFPCFKEKSVVIPVGVLLRVALENQNAAT